MRIPDVRIPLARVRNSVPRQANEKADASRSQAGFETSPVVPGGKSSLMIGRGHRSDPRPCENAEVRAIANI